MSYLLGNIGQALFIRSCHEDVIFTRKSHNCAGTAFVQGDSARGSKLIEQILQVSSNSYTLLVYLMFSFTGQNRRSVQPYFPI